MNFLICLVLVGHLFPGVLAAILTQSQAAWEYVGYGLESAGLWAFIGAELLKVSNNTQVFPLGMITLLGYFESAQRPICRLALPMDQAPELLPNQNLCDAAIGLPMSIISLGAALLVACLLQEVIKNGNQS